MATIPTQTKDFTPGNRWNIADGFQDTNFTMRQLVHAAVTAGHPQGWRQSVLSITGGRAELLMRAAALQSTIYEANTTNGSWRAPVARLFPTERFTKMDDSEKRGLTYHLGITMSVAWARKALRIPWLLHINVYEQQLNINLKPGRSRPDLVGQTTDGSWVVFESKGRTSSPNPQAELKAKRQSQRVVDVGGAVPVSCFALFAYFYRDPQAVGRKKPNVVHLRVKDPEPDGDDEPIRLTALTRDRFFEWYYQPWFQLLTKAGLSEITPEGSLSTQASVAVTKPDPIAWCEVADLDFRVGMLSEVALAIEQKRYADIPRVIQKAVQKDGLADKYPDWAGDGLVIEPGKSWEKLWYEK